MTHEPCEPMREACYAHRPDDLTIESREIHGGVISIAYCKICGNTLGIFPGEAKIENLCFQGGALTIKSC